MSHACRGALRCYDHGVHGQILSNFKQNARARSLCLSLSLSLALSLFPTPTHPPQPRPPSPDCVRLVVATERRLTLCAARWSTGAQSSNLLPCKRARAFRPAFADSNATSSPLPRPLRPRFSIAQQGAREPVARDSRRRRVGASVQRARPPTLLPHLQSQHHRESKTAVRGTAGICYPQRQPDNMPPSGLQANKSPKSPWAMATTARVRSICPRRKCRRFASLARARGGGAISDAKGLRRVGPGMCIPCFPRSRIPRHTQSAH